MNVQRVLLYQLMIVIPVLWCNPVSPVPTPATSGAEIRDYKVGQLCSSNETLSNKRIDSCSYPPRRDNRSRLSCIIKFSITTDEKYCFESKETNLFNCTETDGSLEKAITCRCYFPDTESGICSVYLC